MQLFWPLTLLSVAPQVVEPIEKLAGGDCDEISKLTPASGAPPPLVTVSGRVEVDWITVATKLRLDGLTANSGGAMPVPVRATVCVCSSSWMVSAAVSVPASVGSNCTLIVQLELAGRVAVQGSVTSNSAAPAPATETAMEVSATPPLLVSVTESFCEIGEICPTFVLGKLSEVAERGSVAGPEPAPEPPSRGVIQMPRP